MVSFYVFDPQRLYLGSYHGVREAPDRVNFFVEVTRNLMDELSAARLAQNAEWERTGRDQERMVHDPVARTITPDHLRGA